MELIHFFPFAGSDLGLTGPSRTGRASCGREDLMQVMTQLYHFYVGSGFWGLFRVI
jgi:hypothetical protein